MYRDYELCLQTVSTYASGNSWPTGADVKLSLLANPSHFFGITYPELSRIVISPAFNEGNAVKVFYIWPRVLVDIVGILSFRLVSLILVFNFFIWAFEFSVVNFWDSSLFGIPEK